MAALPPAEGVLSCGQPERATAECEVAEACASQLPRRHCGGAARLDACRGRSTRLGLSRPECPYRLSSPSSPWQAVNRRSGKDVLRQAVDRRSRRLAHRSRSLRRRRPICRLHRPSPRTVGAPRRLRLPRSAMEAWLQAAVAEPSRAYPRLSRLSCLAAPVQEGDQPLPEHLAMPLRDASLKSPKDQNWQALQRRAAVCLRGQRHEFSSHGLCIRPARACACRCLCPPWLGSLGMGSHAPSDVEIDSLQQLGCDLELRLPGYDGKPGTRCQLARGTRSKHPRRKNR